MARQSPRGKAKPKGKANVKGKADGQDQDQALPQELVFCSRCVGSNSIVGWDCIQPGQPLGKAGSLVAKYMLNALVASDPEKYTPLMQHDQGLTKYSDKLKFALQLNLTGLAAS